MVDFNWDFFKLGLRQIHINASLFPSSRVLSRAMALPTRGAMNVVEFGPGTGGMTREILKVMSPNGRLFSIELMPQMAGVLREKVRDPRLHVLDGDATDFPELLKAADCASGIDAFVSSLPLSVMPERRDLLMSQVIAHLNPGGVFTQFAYVHGRVAVYNPTAPSRFYGFNTQDFLGGYFSRVDASVVWRNVPPAFLLVARN